MFFAYDPDERQRRNAVSWAAGTLTKHDAELHATAEGWDVLVPSGALKGWHCCADWRELSALASAVFDDRERTRITNL